MTSRTSPLADILGAQFRSGAPDQIKAAIKTLRPHIVEHAGNLVHTAAALGISRRSIIRWAEQCPDLAALIDSERRK